MAPKYFNCLYCNNKSKFRRSGSNKYCNQICNINHRLDNFQRRWYAGELVGDKQPTRKALVRHLKRIRGAHCEECGQGEIWNNKKLTLQLNHVNGNPADSSPNNVKLVCPNCHSQSPYKGAANKGKGRKSLNIKSWK